MQKAWVDFKEVKDRVNMQMVLDHYQIDWLKAVGGNMRGKCPVHLGGERTFHVSLEKNIFNCFSPKCGAKGNVLDLVAAMEKISVRDAALKLQEWFLSEAKKEPTRAEPSGSKVSVREDVASPNENINPPLSFQLRVDFEHEYGKKRGLAQEIISAFGCGLCLSKGMFAKKFVIPLHNPAGELVGYAGRSLDDTEPKYLFPSSERGFFKSHLLFNLHRVLGQNRDPLDPVIVVEGFFSVMKLHQLGYRAVGLLGGFLSEEQTELLAQNFEKVILLFDGDEAGQVGQQKALELLSRRLFVKTVWLAEGEQPDTVGEEVLRSLLV
jgi:DNA primase